MPSKWYRNLNLYRPRVSPEVLFRVSVDTFHYAIPREWFVLRAWQRYDIPRLKKARKGMTLLDYYAKEIRARNDAQNIEDLKIFFRNVLHKREIYGRKVWENYYSKAADRFFRHRLHRSLKEIVNQFSGIAEKLFFYFYRTLDVCRADIKGDIRLDYFIACLERVLTEIMFRLKNFYSITSGRFDEEDAGSTNVDYLSPSSMSEDTLIGGSMWSADPSLLVEAFDEVRSRIERKVRKIKLILRRPDGEKLGTVVLQGA